MEITMSTVAEIEEKVQAIVDANYPDYEVDFRDTEKVDGKRRAVSMRKKGSNVAPTAYIYEDETRDADVVARELVDILMEAMPDEDIDLNELIDYENVKPKLTFRLVNKVTGMHYLVDKVHVDTEYENLALVPVIKFNVPKGGDGVITVTNQLLKNWNVMWETVVKDAKANAPLITPMKEMEFPDALMRDIVPFKIFTNEQTVQGSSVMMYPEFFKMLDENYPDGVYIIPSSVHEILLMESQGEFGEDDEIERISQIIGAVNSQTVKPEDFLSNNLYGYKDGQVRSW